MRLINHFTEIAKVALLTIPSLTLAMQAQALVHPGGMQTQSALTNAREKVAAGVEPWKSAWEALEASDAQASYQPNVTSHITDQQALQKQGHAAYVLAVKWAVSGEMEYAIAARNILDTWVDTVDSFEFDNFPLRMGIGSIQMANAAEIIATAFNGEAGWSEQKIGKAQDWFREVVDPTVTTGPQRSSNWGTSALGGAMSIAIFLDDEDKFDDAVYAYKYGFQNTDDGCAHVTDYIWHPSGQNNESGRDQAHPEGGVGHLVETALMAWNQGVDIVSFADYRLVAGMEYIAEYNLGYEVPWYFGMPDECDVNPASHEDAISPANRYEFAPVWEMANRLFSYADFPHPFTIEVIESDSYTYYPSKSKGGSYRPETTTSDNPGMGTLLYSAYSSTPTSEATPPTVSFSTPDNNDSVDEGESLSVAVEATDADGTIAMVSLSIDGTFVRTEKKAPYGWGVKDAALQGLSTGVHTLTAVATDNDNQSTEVSISFTVGDVVEEGSSNFISLRKSNSTSFALDGDDGGANRQNVYLWSYGATNKNQQWEEVSRGGDYYSYQKRDTNYCLDGGNGGENRQTVYLYKCSSDNQNQHWKKVTIGNNYRLEKRNAPNYSIDGNANGENGQDVYLWQSSDTNKNQQWQFENN